VTHQLKLANSEIPVLDESKGFQKIYKIDQAKFNDHKLYVFEEKTHLMWNMKVMGLDGNSDMSSKKYSRRSERAIISQEGSRRQLYPN